MALSQSANDTGIASKSDDDDDNDDDDDDDVILNSLEYLLCYEVA